MNDLSVLTLVKNRPAHLDRLIEGLIRSSDPPLELIIVDMSDNPVSVPADASFPITVVRLITQALPLAQARNLAARHANGGRLLFLDVDCIPTRGLVAQMEQALISEDALVCTEVRYLGPSDVADDWTEEILDRSAERHPARPFPTAGRRVEPNAGLFWSLAFGVRKPSFDRVGGFDEGFMGYGAEDTDFGFRCRDAGLPLVFLGGPGAFHQHHGVHHPPLQHFSDIVSNARRFQTLWGVWPMDGWLKAFDALGLVRFNDAGLSLLRPPTASEIDASRQPPTVRY